MKTIEVQYDYKIAKVTYEMGIMDYQITNIIYGKKIFNGIKSLSYVLTDYQAENYIKNNIDVIMLLCFEELLEDKLTYLDEVLNNDIYKYGEERQVYIKENERGKLYLEQDGDNITDDFIEQLEDIKKEIDISIEALKKLSIIKS